MSFLGTLGKIAGVDAPFALAPFTGGTSLLATAAKAGSVAGPALAALGSRGGGGTSDPSTNSLILDSAKGLTDTGRNLLTSGGAEVGRSRALFNPLLERNTRLI